MSQDPDLEAYITSLHVEWDDGRLGKEDLVWLEENHPTLIAGWEEEWTLRHRHPTRQEIVQKMNFRADFGDEDFRRGMNVGVRGLLAEAINRIP